MTIPGFFKRGFYAEQVRALSRDVRGTDKIQFGDPLQYIHRESAGQLNIGAGTTIRLAIGGTEQVVVENGVIHGATDDDVDLGKEDRFFKDAYVKNKVYLGDTFTEIFFNAGDVEFRVKEGKQYVFKDLDIPVLTINNVLSTFADPVQFDGAVTLKTNTKLQLRDMNYSIGSSSPGLLTIDSLAALFLEIGGTLEAVLDGSGLTVTNLVAAKRFVSNVVGSAPISVVSSIVCPSLNANLLQGNLASAFALTSQVVSAVLCFSGATATVLKGATEYLGFGTGAAQSVEANAEIKVPVAGTIKNLRTYVSTNDTGAAGSTITMRKAGSSQTLKTTYGLGETGWMEDTSNSFVVAAGDLVSIQVVNAGSGGGTKDLIVESVTMELAA